MEIKAKVPDPAILTFDPAQADDFIIREVFTHRTARTLWLGIKFSHLVSNYFNANCLELGKIIDVRIAARANWLEWNKTVHRGRPRKEVHACDAQYLDFAMRNYGMMGTHDSFGEQLLPYVLGEKDIRWEIE